MTKRSENIQPTRRLSEFMSPEEARPPLFKADEYEGQELVLHEVEHARGEYGEYVLLTCSQPDSDEKFLISCGSRPVMKQVSAIKQRDLPLNIRLTRAGRGYVIE